MNYNNKLFKVIFLIISVLMFNFQFSVQALAEGNTQNLTPIMGNSQLTSEQMRQTLLKNNTTISYEKANEFVKLVIEEANTEGVKADIAFCQMMYETAYLKFGGDVKPEQNNFAGIGAVGGGAEGASFPDVRTGIRAVIQHLKAYASDQSLKNSCVDPRFSYVKRKSAEYLEWLGIKENPNGLGWATQANYGYNILSMFNNIQGKLETSIKSLNLSASDYKVGSSITATANAVSTNGAQYRFWIGDLETGKWTIIQDYSSKNTVTWTPTYKGRFEINVHVRDSKSSKAYEAVKYTDIDVKNKEIPTQITGLNLSTNDYKVGNAITITSKAVSTNGAQYRFWIGDLETGKWTIIQDYSSKNTVTWTPTYKGRFEINVHVRDSKSNKAYEAVKHIDIDVKNKEIPTQITGLNLSTNDYKVGNAITITSKAVSTNGAQYRFWIGDLETGKWTIIQDYSSKNTVTWTPTYKGRFEINVHVRDSKSSKAYEAVKYTDIDVKNKEIPTQITGLNLSTNDYKVGNAITITSKAVSTNGAQYRFWIGDLETGKWTIIQDYSSKNTVTWTPTYKGRFEINVHVRDSKSNKAYEAVKYTDIDVKNKEIPTQITGLNLSTNDYKVGNAITITSKAVSTNGAQYRFWIGDLETGKWTIIQDYSSKNTVTWTPTYKGRFEINVHVRDSKSNKAYEAVKHIDIDVKNKEIPTQITGLNLSTNDYKVGNAITITSKAVSTNGAQYRFWIGDLETGKWTIIQDYSSKNTVTWTPTYKGRFEINVHVRDSKSSKAYEAVKYTDIDVKNKEIPTQITGLNLSTNDYKVGNAITITSKAVSTNGAQYRFWIGDLETGKWTIIQDYSSKNTVTWTPTYKGRFEINVHVRDSKSNKAYEAVKYTDIDVKKDGLVIVLDAGHGGIDPGTISSDRIYKEAELNESLTRKVGELLSKIGIKVIYTRDIIPERNSQITVSQDLQNRINVANGIYADLFLSIHHDSSGASAHGISAHYSSYRPEIDNSGTYEKDGITYDSTPCQQAKDSQILAKKIVDSLSNLGFSNRGTLDHNLYVTKAAKVPSVLLEAGFISNYDEVRKVANPAMQYKMAEKIRDAIRSFFGI
ncbi:N-acetylmuramoyl-L-alanine amidase [Clostridium sp. KNHs214]|uniref:N-acetylmuramoyl-L-alanine amidase n=1 Tax=Clostridium sp. KNHs214 TaxID=1540257 RepID=UPI00054F375F|nr:N-acetylmuramoyl-L-alanine amidase [Clostridium sp. KNHs214]